MNDREREALSEFPFRSDLPPAPFILWVTYSIFDACIQEPLGYARGAAPRS